MRLRSVSVVLILLSLFLGTVALLFIRRAAREQPAPYLLVELPAWLPSRTPPAVWNTAGEDGGAEAPEFPFGARKTLRVATLRNDDVQAYGFGALAVHERGSHISLEVFLPPLPSGDRYDAAVIMDDGTAVSLGPLTDRGDGWHAAEHDFPGRNLGAAQALRVAASVPKEPLIDGMTVVEGALNDVID